MTVHFVKEGAVVSRDSRSSDKFMHGIKVLMTKNYVDNLLRWSVIPTVTDSCPMRTAHAESDRGRLDSPPAETKEGSRGTL